MTEQEELALAEVVLRTRGHGFRATMDEIKPLVEEVIVHLEWRAVTAEKMADDLRWLIRNAMP